MCFNCLFDFVFAIIICTSMRVNYEISRRSAHSDKFLFSNKDKLFVHFFAFSLFLPNQNENISRLLLLKRFKCVIRCESFECTKIGNLIPNFNFQNI